LTLRKERIRKRLEADFAPMHLDVHDDSASHAGHAGARPEGETHFTVEIWSEAFSGLGRLARQRAVTKALQSEFDSGLHALVIRARAPDEDQAPGPA